MLIPVIFCFLCAGDAIHKHEKRRGGGDVEREVARVVVGGGGNAVGQLAAVAATVAAVLLVEGWRGDAERAAVRPERLALDAHRPQVGPAVDVPLGLAERHRRGEAVNVARD